MIDREKVIKSLEICSENISCDGCEYEEYHGDGCFYKHLMGDALELLKKQEAQKFFVDKSGKITPLPVVVRCKDCIHLDPEDHHCDSGHDIVWQLSRRDDWYCADGEKAVK